VRREKGRVLGRGETGALEEGLELVDGVVAEVARDGALGVHVRRVRVGFGEEVLEEGGGVSAHVVSVQEVETACGVEVVEQCGLGFFYGGFSDELGGGFGGLESRVLAGFKQEEEVSVEFSKG